MGNNTSKPPSPSTFPVAQLVLFVDVYARVLRLVWLGIEDIPFEASSTRNSIAFRHSFEYPLHLRQWLEGRALADLRRLRPCAPHRHPGSRRYDCDPRLPSQ